MKDKHDKVDKFSRRSDEKKQKNRHRSKSRERSSRRRRSSSSPEKVQPKLINLPKPSPSPSTSSSPQKSPMISLGALKPVEPKVELPAYYNPNVINVNKFAEQQQKRKLIWSGKKEEAAKDSAKWGTAKFSQDNDGSKASKFMRLMGIKDGKNEKFSQSHENSDNFSITAPKPEASAAAKPSDDLFSNMEQQYEVARQVTHISRGVGLGFGSRPF